jgi:L-alanine-DL-glutamate epimerase-like enolase superfamily enzyme
MAIGGVRAAAAIARRALRAGIGVVVTSILDTAVGVAGALHLAAILPASGPACGLATLDLFHDAPTTGVGMPVNGSLALPERAGLGVRLSDLGE